MEMRRISISLCCVRPERWVATLRVHGTVEPSCLSFLCWESILRLNKGLPRLRRSALKAFQDNDFRFERDP